MRIGKRLACDTCGRIESSTVIVSQDTSDSNKHICEECRLVNLSHELISSLAKK
jgi:hypothetical protein